MAALFPQHPSALSAQPWQPSHGLALPLTSKYIFHAAYATAAVMMSADMIYCHMRKSLYGYDKGHVEGVEEAIDAYLPLVLVANVILAP